MEELLNTKFNDYTVSTKTFIASSNIDLEIQSIFEFLPLTDFVVVQKKRGRKKKNQEENPNKHLSTGSIIMVKMGNNIRGAQLKELKKNKKKGFFRNSMTVKIFIENKLIDFKVTRNGKFQMTGCKTDEQAEKCIFCFWNYIKDQKEYYRFKKETYTELEVIFEPVMYNIDFSLGFLVNRENLDKYINTKTMHTSLLETTFGYTGVNIKIPTNIPLKTLLIKKITESGAVTHVSYEDFLKETKPIKLTKKQKQKRFNTFLVFQSGKVIMSGQSAVFMENTYYDFINIIKDCYSLIKETIVI